MAKQTLIERVTVLETELHGTNSKGLSERFDDFVDESRAHWNNSKSRKTLYVLKDAAQIAAIAGLMLKLFGVF